MVVVEEARDRQNETVTVEVMRSIQTSAGRMVFARLLESDSAAFPPSDTTGDRASEQPAEEATEQTGALSQ